jgi:hypothetical protein
MTDAVAGEMPTEPESAPLLAAIEALAIDEAPTKLTPAGAEAPIEVAPTEPVAVDAADPVAERAMPVLEHEIGETRRRVLEHMVDTVESGAQSVSQIIAGLGNVTRNTAESAIKRNFDAGLIERVGPGLYVLAKPKPKPSPPPPPPEQVRSDGEIDEQQWLSWIEEWKATGEWKGLGNPPDQSGHLVPVDVISKYHERVRKREQRRRDAEAAAARQAEADRQLRDKLIAATYGNFMLGPAIDDVAPIRAAMELVPLDIILGGIRYKCDKKLYPPNEPARSWREERLLKTIAEHYCREIIVPSLVRGWSAAPTHLRSLRRRQRRRPLSKHRPSRKAHRRRLPARLLTVRTMKSARRTCSSVLASGATQQRIRRM